jgi:hypothetical protein
MSMALALEFTQTWLRDRFSWKWNECAVSHDALPSYDAGNFFIAIDDMGVETGSEVTDSLREILNIQIGIWRRPEFLAKDRRGLLKMPQDLYLLGSWTLHDLERAVIVHKSGDPTKPNGLHNNWSFRTALNTYCNLPNENDGAEFITPWNYRGRGRMESVTLDNRGGEDQAFLGYRLRFRGCMREQKLRETEDAIG